MTRRSLNQWRRVVRLAACLAIVAIALTCVAQAQTPPSALFQNATLTGSGSTITATRVPVAISATLTIYVDIAMQFVADANGNLTMAAGYPQIVPSPTLLTGSGKAGNYVGPGNLFNGKGNVIVSGPGVGDGGTTTWSLGAAIGADGSTLTSATWYVGLIANSPMAARLKAANITSTAWSYGVSGASVANYRWCAGSLIGVSQTGNAVTIANFTDRSCNDQSAPQDQVTFTLVQ